MPHRIVFVLSLAAFLSSCTSKTEGLEQLSAIETKWQDGMKVASSTSRMSLSSPVANLQATKRELGGLKVSSCLDPAKAALHAHMESMVDGFVAFMAQKSSASDDAIKKGDAHMESFKLAKAKCSA